MLRIGCHFQFETPDGWEESREGPRWVYRSSSGEEPIVSSAFVDDDLGLVEREAAEERLLRQWMNAARRGATLDGLVNVIPLKPDEAMTELRCWTFVSETGARDAVFAGCVASSGPGVLLVTIEGGYGPEPLEVLRRFLKSLRKPTN